MYDLHLPDGAPTDPQSMSVVPDRETMKTEATHGGKHPRKRRMEPSDRCGRHGNGDEWQWMKHWEHLHESLHIEQLDMSMNPRLGNSVSSFLGLQWCIYLCFLTIYFGKSHNNLHLIDITFRRLIYYIYLNYFIIPLTALPIFFLYFNYISRLSNHFSLGSAFSPIWSKVKQ